VLDVVVPVRGTTCVLCTREESIRRLRGVVTAKADPDTGHMRFAVGKEHPLAFSLPGKVEPVSGPDAGEPSQRPGCRTTTTV
jgi:hypothetical protein